MSPAGLRGRVMMWKGNEVTIGDRIRRIRKKRRLTQAELAMMSGLSLSAIQGYEQGRYEPKRKSLESIAEVFKIPVYELYDTPAQLGTNLAEVGTDLISRQALLDKFEPWLKVKDYNDGELNMLKAILYEIRFMRSAQPEPSQVARDIARIVENEQDMRILPKRGKWIDRGEHGDWEWQADGRGKHWHEWECNACHHYFAERSFFCPHCGADMRKETT